MVRTITWFLTVLMCALLLTTSALAGPTIVNGSFETPVVLPGENNYPVVPGWTHTGTIGDGWLWHAGPTCCGGTGLASAGDGQQFVTLGGGFGVPGSAAWSQTLTGLIAGDSYVITFMIASEGETPTQDMTVGMTSGSSTASQTFTSPITNTLFWQNWGTDHYTFLATAASGTLQFSVDNQPYDMGLDAVSIAPVSTGVPEPSSLLLLGTGLLGFGFNLRRK